jgi:ATP-dependent Clp protease protease subunit
LEATELARIRSEAEALLARHTNRTVDQIRVDTDRALVLTGEEAVTYGIADQVLDHAESGREQHGAAVASLDT